MRFCFIVLVLFTLNYIVPDRAHAQLDQGNKIVAGYILKPSRFFESDVAKMLVSQIDDKAVLTDIDDNIQQGLGIRIRDIESVMVLLDRNTTYQLAGLEVPRSDEYPEGSIPYRTLKNNVKLIGLAMHNFCDVYDKFVSVDGHEGSRGNLSWRVHLLPFLQQNKLYQQFRLDEPWDSEHNKKLIPKMPDVFKVNSKDPAGHTRIRLLTGKNGRASTPFSPNQSMRLRDITDGTSNTLMTVVAGSDQTIEWTKPVGLELKPGAPSATLGQIGPKFIAGLCDGSVFEFSQNLSVQNFHALATANDGKVVDLKTDRFDRSPPTPIVILTTTKPIDQQAVTNAPQAIEMGKIVYPSPQQLIAGPTNYAEDIPTLIAESPGSVVSRLKDLIKSHDIAVVADFKDIKPAMMQLANRIPGANLAGALESLQIKSSISQSGSDLLRIELKTSNQQTATQFQALASGMIQAFVSNIEMQDQSQIAPPKLLGQMLSDVQIEANESTVAGFINKPNDLLDQIQQSGPQIKELVDTLKLQRKIAAEVQQKNSLKWIALAMHNYHDIYTRFPRANGDANGRSTGLSWRVHLLPLLEQSDLYEQFHFNEPWDSAHNKTLIKQMPDQFQVEGVPHGQTSIHLFGGLGPWKKSDKGPRIRDFVDGTSNTFMMVVAGKDAAVPWTKPGALDFNGTNAAELIGDTGENLLFALTDGSVRKVPRSVLTQSLLSKLIQANDGQIVEDY